jgi:hypothetical protein
VHKSANFEGIGGPGIEVAHTYLTKNDRLLFPSTIFFCAPYRPLGLKSYSYSPSSSYSNFFFR